MQTISNTLFFISNGLLVPVVILLLILFLRALLLAINFYGDYQQRKKILEKTLFINDNDREKIIEGIKGLEAGKNLNLQD